MARAQHAGKENQSIIIHEDQDIMFSKAVLGKMASIWERRAQVKKEIFPKTDILDPSKPDFLVDLLPFGEHPDFLAASENMQQKILSCGWLAYNEKTIAIESAIISPACNYILYGLIPGANDSISRQLISETLVDEAYHILMVVNACKITSQQRQLTITHFPMFSLEKNMKMTQDKFSEDWQKRLVCLATAIVSEIFISDYLDQLSGEEGIQPLNRLTVEAHRKDELAHSNIFTHLTKCIYASLSAKEKKFFAEMLPQPVRWFADGEFDVWEHMLEQIGFKKIRTVIEDSRRLNDKRIDKIDFSGIISLAGELGILDDKLGREAFVKAGLIKG